MMDRPFGQRPGSLPSVVNQHIDCFCSTACAKRVSAISTVIPDRLQIPCVAHERVHLVDFMDFGCPTVETPQRIFSRNMRRVPGLKRIADIVRAEKNTSELQSL